MTTTTRSGFLGSPHTATYAIILLNAIAFGVCLIGNSAFRIDGRTLFDLGALHTEAINRHEYWRLLAYAFLHANVLHFALNMMCIAAWSGILEQRLGATYFLLVYLVSAVGGGVASVYGHHGPFLGVGASGAISGTVGALLCLTLLGKLALAPTFFLVTIGLNGVIAAQARNIDWIAHLGGFTAGFIMIALLNLFEMINRFWLRCKFPEFVKFGLAVIAMTLAAIVVPKTAANPSQAVTYVAGWLLSVVLLIKLADIVLAQTKGLAVVAFAVACGYAVLAFAAINAAKGSLPGYCAQGYTVPATQTAFPFASLPRGALCFNLDLLGLAGALFVFVLALIALRPEIKRGAGDVGLIANTLRAERGRRTSL